MYGDRKTPGENEKLLELGDLETGWAVTSG